MASFLGKQANKKAKVVLYNTKQIVAEIQEKKVSKSKKK